VDLQHSPQGYGANRNVKAPCTLAKWSAPDGARSRGGCCSYLARPFWSARKIYADRLAARAFSSGMPLVRAGPSSPLPTLLFVGDSRVTEWNCQRLASFHVVNAGFSGMYHLPDREAHPSTAREI